MKFRNFRKLLATSLILAMIISLLSLHIFASDDIYVNTNGDVLGTDISSAYAIGGSGTVSALQSDYVYVITGNGMETIGTLNPDDPEHLYVSGTVNVSQSKIRVGLYYYDSTSSIRNETLESANLQNEVGSGYKFGYYNSNREFVEVGYTYETKITMSMDTNISLAGGDIGSYHILLPDTYASYEAALAVANSYDDGFPAYYSGKYRVLVGNYESADLATAAMEARGISGTAYTASNKCIVVTRTTDSKILFEFDYGSIYNLAVSPQSDDGKAETWFKGYTYYGDFEYSRRTGEELTVINTVDIEDYVKGVLPYEMSSSWPLEALKAQALCARTYAASNLYSYSSYGFDVTNDTYCQVYRGTSLSSANSDKAVDETAGIYITYNGSLISAVYSSSFGGGSENSENVFGSTTAYLRGVIDPYEAAADSINGKSSWSYTFTKSELITKLKNAGYSISDISSIEVTLSDTNNAIGLKFISSSGTSVSITGSKCYTFSCSTLGLPAIHYTVSISGNNVTFTGAGYGHNLGMSQFGAYAMATTYGFTYDQIVNFYYTDIKLSSANYN